jgi:hypothetical protein
VTRALPASPVDIATPNRGMFRNYDNVRVILGAGSAPRRTCVVDWGAAHFIFLVVIATVWSWLSDSPGPIGPSAPDTVDYRSS